MSFDVFLFRFDESALNREPIRDILRRYRCSEPDSYGWYIVEFPDQVIVEFSARELEQEGPFSSCCFHIRGISRHLADVIFDIARAGNMVIFPGGAPVLISPEQTASLPSGFPALDEPPVCGSAEDLWVRLRGGHERWADYLKHVTDHLDQK